MIGVGIDAPDFYRLSNKGPYIVIGVPEPGVISIYPFKNPRSFKEHLTFTEAKQPHLHRLVRTIFDSKNFRWKE